MKEEVTMFKRRNKQFEDTKSDRSTSRRSFFRGTAGVGMGALAGAMPAFQAPSPGPGITAGDVDILRFLAAAEFLETDLWDQYWELAAGNEAYGKALNKIEDELVTYTCDVAAAERSHAQFINAFLVANGKPPVNVDDFRTLPSSPAFGAQLLGRLTNLMQLTVDTSWYLRYRDPGFRGQVPSVRQHRRPACDSTLERRLGV